MLRPLLGLVLILTLAVGESAQRCFITNDWANGTIVPGEPNVLIWKSGAPNRDLLLSTVNNSETAFAGSIAREFMTSYMKDV